MFKSSDITDIIKFTLLSIAILGLGLFWPGLMVVVYIAWPIPVIWLVYRYSLPAGIFSLAMAFILTLALSGDLLASLSFILQIGLIAIMIAMLFKYKDRFPFKKGLPILLAVTGLISLAGMLLEKLILGAEILSLGESESGFIDEMVALYQEAGVLSGNSEQLTAVLEKVYYWIGALMPGMTIVWMLMAATLIFLIARELFRNREIDIYPVPAFSKWRISRWEIIWSFIVGLSLILLGDWLETQILSIIGYNILLVFAVVFMFTGLATLVTIFRLIKINKIFKIILIVILLLEFPATLIFLVLLGLLDPIVNFRKIYTPKKNKKQSNKKEL